MGGPSGPRLLFQVAAI
ncbi:DUF6053 domain-containing protein [Lysobacter enzymogenes]